MSHRERVEAFTDKVRAAYINVFGDNPWRDTDADPDQPFIIGPVLVAFETHLADDPDAVVSVLFDGTTVSAPAGQPERWRRMKEAAKHSDRVFELLGALRIRFPLRLSAARGRTSNRSSTRRSGTGDQE